MVSGNYKMHAMNRNISWVDLRFPPCR